MPTMLPTAEADAARPLGTASDSAAPDILGPVHVAPAKSPAWERLEAAWNWKPFQSRPPTQRLVLESLLWIAFLCGMLQLPRLTMS